MTPIKQVTVVSIGTVQIDPAAAGLLATALRGHGTMRV
ncbi:hypothetical protein B0E54_06096 [Micromonospora sp. MH99]|nr:hypothetical protein [Micromonospora sp. MH99]